MLRMLIVDDEALIADGLYYIFQEIKEPELDVYKAYSGFEALEFLNRYRVDIVLTDIRMPGIDGMQLLEQIARRWPLCRVIFLTGHNEFDYVYKAIQHKGVSYVLKTEGNRKVIEVVKAVTGDIEASLRQEDVVRRASEQMRTVASLLKQEYLGNMLQVGAYMPSIQADFAQMQIPLSADLGVMILIGHADSLAECAGFSEKQKLLYSVRLIAEQFFTQFVKTAAVVDRSLNLVWLLQPAFSIAVPDDPLSPSSVWSRTALYVNGALELMQAACRESLKATVSFAFDQNPVEWACLPQRYASLVRRMEYNMGDNGELLLTGRGQENAPKDDNLAGGLKSSQLLRKAEALGPLLETGQSEEYFRIFEEIGKEFLNAGGIHFGALAEVYYTIVLALLSYINRWKIADKLPLRQNPDMLMDFRAHGSPDAAVKRLLDLSHELFAIKNREVKARNSGIVTTIEKYVEGHMDGDLSLIKLAEIVGYNPSYFSRMFKDAKGENLSDYITGAKIAKAKSLLGNAETRIQEVAEAVGYTSAANFARFFRMFTGITPHEYREAVLAEGKRTDET